MHLIKLELIVAIYQATFSRYHFSPAMQMLLSLIRRLLLGVFEQRARLRLHTFSHYCIIRAFHLPASDTRSLSHLRTGKTRLRAFVSQSAVAFAFPK